MCCNEIQDFGPNPLVINLNRVTAINRNFRTALWTGEHLQMTLMEIKVGETIGLEKHEDVDQFLYILTGYGQVRMGNCESCLDYRRQATAGFGVFIPAGTYHNLLNVGNVPIKLFSIYAPPNHPKGTVDVTKLDAQD